MPRYEKEFAEGNLAAGIVTGMKAWPILEIGSRHFPRFAMINLMRLAIRADRRNMKSEDASLESLIRSLHFDLCNVADRWGHIRSIRAIKADVLLLGGTFAAPRTSRPSCRL